MLTVENKLKNETQRTNTPVYMEAFEQQKNGVLLLSRLQPPDVRLHGDQLVSDKRLPEVVKLSSVHPAQTRHWLSEGEHLSMSF